MSGLSSRRKLFQGVSALGLLSALGGCPRPTQILEVPPNELLAGTGLSAEVVEVSLQRLRAAGISAGELFVQRRLRRQLICERSRADYSTTTSTGLALRVTRDGAEVDTAIGRVDAPTLDKLLARVGVPPLTAPEKPEAPAASSTASPPSELMSGEDHRSPRRTPTTAELGAIHVALAQGLIVEESLKSTLTVTEDSVVVVTIDGRLTRRAVVHAHLDATLSRNDRRATVRSDLFDLLGPTSEPARTALLGRLRGTVMAASASPPPGPIPVLIHAGGGAQWLAHLAWGVSGPVAATEGPLDSLGAVDDAGLAPSAGPWTLDQPTTRFRLHFDEDLVPHPRGIQLFAEKSSSANKMVDAFLEGLRVVRLDGPAVQVEDGVVLRVAEGWWHRPDHPPAVVSRSTRLWLPTRQASAVTAVGDDALTVMLEQRTAPLLEVAHPTVQLTGARVEAHNG